MLSFHFRKRILRKNKMSKKKILLIDDEPDVILFLTAVLEEHNYEVFSVPETKTAMNMLMLVNPDLICLDIMMPGETGISFYTRLRRENSFAEIPVIIISGAVDRGKFDYHSYVEDESIQKPDGFMEKPINVGDFLNKVEQLLKLN